MQTSYFARSGKEPNAVAICRSIPKFFKGPSDMRFAPPWFLLSKAEDYTKQDYKRHVLDKLDPKVMWEIHKDNILLCYEKDRESCHRLWVAEWFEKNIQGASVPEIPGKKNPQMLLF